MHYVIRRLIATRWLGKGYVCNCKSGVDRSFQKNKVVSIGEFCEESRYKGCGKPATNQRHGRAQPPDSRWIVNFCGRGSMTTYSDTKLPTSLELSHQQICRRRKNKQILAEDLPLGRLQIDRGVIY